MGPAPSRFPLLARCRDRYAVIKLEMLAVTWTIMKCCLFLAGLQHFNVITDHNPLISILNTHHLDEIENPRLQCLKPESQGTIWTRGSNHHAPDALSQHPTTKPGNEDTLAETDSQLRQEITISEIWAVSCMGLMLPTCLQDLWDKVAQDTEYKVLHSTIDSMVFQHTTIIFPKPASSFWPLMTASLFMVASYWSPEPCTITDLHEAHQGIVCTKQQACMTVYWPGIDDDIENVITACQLCQDHLPSNPKELIVSKPKPLCPFQEIACWLCHIWW